MANWRQRFGEPIHLLDGTVIKTLAEARAWLIEIDSDRNEFQNAAGKILTAADGGDLVEARRAVAAAAFLSMKLDVSKSKV